MSYSLILPAANEVKHFFKSNLNPFTNSAKRLLIRTEGRNPNYFD